MRVSQVRHVGADGCDEAALEQERDGRGRPLAHGGAAAEKGSLALGAGTIGDVCFPQASTNRCLANSFTRW